MEDNNQITKMQEILINIYDKAIAGGFHLPQIMKKRIIEEHNPFEIIFTHDFAKAFWGEDDLKYYLSDNHLETKTVPEWQYHLQQMVLEENPLKYLEKFL